MAKWFYYNNRGEKIEVTGGQLKGLAKAGVITPETVVENEEGKSAPAGKVKGLTFVATVSNESTTPEPLQPLLSNASPANSVVITPSAVHDATTESDAPNGTSCVGTMWMHWAWFFIPLASLIIWSVIKGKEPHANTHGKHVLNAYLTFLIHGIVFMASIAITTVVNAVIHETMLVLTDDVVPLLFSGLIYLTICAWIIFFSIRAIVSAIKIGTAAGNGEIVPYNWAICFFKTDFCENDLVSSTSKGKEFFILGLLIIGTIVVNGMNYSYCSHKSALNEIHFDNVAKTMRNETEEFIAKQRKETDALIAGIRGERDRVRDEATKTEFLEKMEKAELMPVFEGSSIKQLLNAKAIFSPFTDADIISGVGFRTSDYTIRLSELPEPYKQVGTHFYISSQNMPIVLLDGTNFIFVDPDTFNKVWGILQKFDYADVRAKEYVLRKQSANKHLSSLDENMIARDLLERDMIYHLAKHFPEERRGVLDVFLQTNSRYSSYMDPINVDPYGISISPGYVLENFYQTKFVISFFCSGASQTFSIKIWADVQNNTRRIRNRTKLEIYTDGEYPINAQSFRVSDDDGVVFDSGKIEFAEPLYSPAKKPFAQLASIDISNKDRDAILNAISSDGKCEFVFYGSDNRFRTATMEPEHRERFKNMRELIQTVAQNPVRFGVTANDNKGDGVIITDIADGLPGARAGLKRGDVILAINDNVVKTAQEFSDVVRSVEKTMVLTVRKAGARNTVTITIELPPRVPVEPP